MISRDGIRIFVPPTPPAYHSLVGQVKATKVAMEALVDLSI